MQPTLNKKDGYIVALSLLNMHPKQVKEKLAIYNGVDLLTIHECIEEIEKEYIS